MECVVQLLTYMYGIHYLFQEVGYYLFYVIKQKLEHFKNIRKVELEFFRKFKDLFLHP